MNNLQVFFILVPVLSVILLALNLLLSPRISDAAKKTIYECGFLPIMEQTRNQFSISFYITAMLFLIFDLEVLTMFPITVVLENVGIFGFSIFMLFTFVLTIGFVLEIGSGAIKFSSMVGDLPNNSTNKNNTEFIKFSNKNSSNLDNKVNTDDLIFNYSNKNTISSK
jgi:NADH:ubiquinone oxidoreductase subunit 3 (subunit A)